jgi:hypothetical protein
MEVFAIVFIFLIIASFYAHACAVLNDGEDPILNALADKLVRFVDSRNAKKKDV